jgi:hypothetical protein
VREKAKEMAAAPPRFGHLFLCHFKRNQTALSPRDPREHNTTKHVKQAFLRKNQA